MIGLLKSINVKKLVSQINNLINYQKPFDIGENPGTTVVWDMLKGYNTYLLLSSNKTLVLNNLTAGDYGTLVITQGGSGNNVLTLPSNSEGDIEFGDVNSKDILGFYYDGITIFWSIKNYSA